MKKALALVLALVLALSMGVSAFAATGLVVLGDQTPAAEELPVIDIVDFDEYVLYIETAGEYYIALEDKAYTDIKLTANGCVDAELVAYDPEKMVVTGNLVPTYSVTYKGEEYALDQTNVRDSVAIANTLTKDDVAFVGGMLKMILSQEETLKAFKEFVIKDGMSISEACNAVFGMTGVIEYVDGVYTYAEAKALAEALNDAYQVTYYGIELNENVNIIKVTVADNFSAHYEEGTIKIDAKLGKKDFSATLTVINDVTIFEYEQVKWAALNGESLQLGANGYSDYFTAEYGYDFGDWEYDVDELRTAEHALVVSTTAFRAIEGKNLTLDIIPQHDFDGDKVVDMEVSVTLKEIVAGQKGVNFFVSADAAWDDEDEDEKWDAGKEALESISFGFEGDQVVKGKYEIVVNLPYNYYELREAFSLKVEEDDIISYYVVDEDGKLVKEIKVDYMTLDMDKNVAFTIEGENDTLGYYTLCLEVPAAETEGEENPNTGAESVVGVVAALAVVSVATAAAVSLKK